MAPNAADKLGQSIVTTMKRLWVVFGTIGLPLQFGCTPDATTGPVANPSVLEGYVAPASTEHLPLVDHPEHVAWSRFSAGAEVVRKKVVTSVGGQVTVTTTVRLMEKTADRVAVETQVVVVREGAEPVENPPLRAEFPATFRLPPSLQFEQFQLPSLKAKLIGEELRTVCGREFTTQQFGWREVNETGPMEVRYWRSDEIPGRLLRQEINGPNHASVEEVVEISLPPSEPLRAAGHSG